MAHGEAEGDGERRRKRKTGVERKNERERPVMAAMMTVSGCIYRLSRSVPARRPSRVNLNRSVSTRYSTLASRIAPIEFPVPVYSHALDSARLVSPGCEHKFPNDRPIARGSGLRNWLKPNLPVGRDARSNLNLKGHWL